ncbi:MULTISPECIES: hypothetical protein [unclassified Solwaraspora]|uniref:hypothetical protein n=1 Tax=unclassified Solwaraspora TaxID=2627926 RepID=UPI00249B18DA|nr:MULTISPECIES: hypothetical protein [unclassified Solwaraspora]WFE22615.1 hypothetical protein O7621_04515 [Solwaraspora sp. WMMD937]WJK33511.1 hypothetical protein O7610_22920 [Solwaraspora sp. WMMA2065]
MRDDDTEWLAAATPRPWTNRLTPWLVAVLLLVAGFAVGVAVPSNDDTGAGAGPGLRGSGAGQFQPGAGQLQRGGAADATGAEGGGPQPAAVGTVKLVDGDTVYVETEAGEVVIVRTDGGTAVRVPGDLDGLAVGVPVSVAGETATDGTVSAESIVAGD